MAQGALQMSLANLVDYLTQEEEDRVVPLSALADAIAGGARKPLDLAFGEEAVTQAGQMAAATPGGVAKIVTEDIPAMAALGGDLAGAIAQPSTQRLQSGREAGAKTRNILSQVVDQIQREGALGTATRGLEAMGEGMGQAIDERGFAAFVGPEDAIPGVGKLLAVLGMAAPVARMGKAARQADLPKKAVEEFGEQVAPQAAPKAQNLEERAAAVGYTRPAYHGSTHDIREFDLNRANVENYLGQAHYFTTSPKDASANYGGMGPDLKARVEREVEQMVDVPIDELADMVDDTVRRQYERKIDFVENRVGQIHDEDLKLRQRTINEQGVDNYEVWPQPVKDRLSDLQAEVQNLKFEKNQIDSQLLLEAAKANLKGPSEGMVYDVQLRLDNPLYIDGSKKEPVFEIETVYDDAGDFVEERGNGLDLVQAIHDAAAGFDGDAEAIVREFMEKGGDQMLDGMKASEVDSALRGLDSVYDLYDETGDSARTEFIRQVYENLGYDSVIMDPAKEFPHMDNVPTGTRHYIVFDKYANKIRSKRAAFDPKKIGSRDILATVTPIAAPGLAAGYLATREQE